VRSGPVDCRPRRNRVRWRRVVHAIIVAGVEWRKLDIGHDIVDNGTYDRIDDRTHNRRVDGWFYNRIDGSYDRRDDYGNHRRDDRRDHGIDNGCQHHRVDDERYDGRDDGRDNRRMHRQHDGQQCRDDWVDYGHGNVGRQHRRNNGIGNYGQQHDRDDHHGIDDGLYRRRYDR